MTKIRYQEFDRRRAQLVGTLHGRLLEIGAGTGANFDCLAADAEWIGLEPDAAARAELDANAAARGYRTPALSSFAEAIPLDSASVDAVLGTAVLCSVRDPAAVLAELDRGCHWDRDTAALLQASSLRGDLQRMDIAQGLLPSVPAILFAGTASA